jgi:hypothetical protein
MCTVSPDHMFVSSLSAEGPFFTVEQWAYGGLKAVEEGRRGSQYCTEKPIHSSVHSVLSTKVELLNTSQLIQFLLVYLRKICVFNITPSWGPITRKPSKRFYPLLLKVLKIKQKRNRTVSQKFMRRFSFWIPFGPNFYNFVIIKNIFLTRRYIPNPAVIESMDAEGTFFFRKKADFSAEKPGFSYRQKQT